MNAAEEMTREQKEVKLRMILQDYHRRNNYELQQAVNDILALDALPPAEGAEQLTKEQFTAIIEDSVKDIWYGRRSINPVKEQTELLVEKLYPLMNKPQPTAEGAGEILCERDDAEDFLQTKDIWNHPRISDRTDKESYEVADLMAEFAQKFATLHAQKIADKMVGERLREELMTYDKFLSNTYWGISHITKREEAVDEYLKSRESHDTIR